MMDISRYEYKLSIHEQVLPEKETIQTLMGLTDEKTKIPYAILNAPTPDYSEVSFEEAYNYSKKLVDNLYEVANVIGSEDEKRMCVCLLLGNVINKVTSNLISLYESVANVTVEENSWQWLFRENLRHKLLVCYSKENKFDKMKELINILKPNLELFTESWNSFLLSFSTPIIR